MIPGKIYDNAKSHNVNLYFERRLVEYSCPSFMTPYLKRCFRPKSSHEARPCFKLLIKVILFMATKGVGETAPNYFSILHIMPLMNNASWKTWHYTSSFLIIKDCFKSTLLDSTPRRMHSKSSTPECSIFDKFH